jgi:hypothetical protein
MSNARQANFGYLLVGLLVTLLRKAPIVSKG